MKKFSKLLAVLLAIAVVICPMTSAIVANATGTNGYSLEVVDANDLVLTISSTDGFLVYKATVTLSSGTFDSTYGTTNGRAELDRYEGGLKIVSFAVKSPAVADEDGTGNYPDVSCNVNGSALTFIVSAWDGDNLDLYTEVKIGIRVSSGAQAALTNLQAADSGSGNVEDDPTLLGFANVSESGAVSQESNPAATPAATHNHTYGTGSYVADSNPAKHSKTCTVEGCNDTIEEACDALGVDAAVPATCTATGLTAGTHCSACGHVITARTTTPMISHSLTPTAAVSPTCTTDGNIAYWTCSSCGKYFSDANGETEITSEQRVDPATGHDMSVYHAAVAATCSAQGNTAYYECANCHAYYSSDAEGNEPLTSGEWLIATNENNHNYVAGTPVEPTCTTYGYTVYTCSLCGDNYEGDIVAATGHSYSAFAHVENSDPAKHSKECSVCHDVVEQACDTAGAEGACSVCGFKAACTHNYVGAVTTQPTKTSTGVMTYTCSLCDDSYTDTIAIPTLDNHVVYNHNLNVSSVVADQITVSTRYIREDYGVGSTYFISVDYETYSDSSDLYNLNDAHTTLDSSNRETAVGTSTANKDIINFKNMALYELTLDFDMTLYIKNPSGVVVGYREYESNIADMAFDLAEKYPTDTNLLTCLADMCNYGKAAQTYFAAANSTKDIVEAEDPTTALGDYMENASSIAILPGAGEYDNTKIQNTKIVPETGFISAAMTLNIASSNRIQYTLRADEYDFADCEIIMSYTSIYGEKEFTVDMADLSDFGLTAAGKQKYLYYFDNLAIYDVNAVVTMSMYHNSTLEMTSQYSVGNFVNQDIDQDSELGTVLRTMELFANSTAIQLGAGSIFS